MYHGIVEDRAESLTLTANNIFPFLSPDPIPLPSTATEFPRRGYQSSMGVLPRDPYLSRIVSKGLRAGRLDGLPALLPGFSGHHSRSSLRPCATVPTARVNSSGGVGKLNDRVMGVGARTLTTYMY